VEGFEPAQADRGARRQVSGANEQKCISLFGGDHHAFDQHLAKNSSKTYHEEMIFPFNSMAWKMPREV
jgi:hypothetical protein